MCNGVLRGYYGFALVVLAFCGFFLVCVRCVLAFSGVLPGCVSLCPGVLRGSSWVAFVVSWRFAGFFLGCVRCVAAFCGFLWAALVCRAFCGFLPGLRSLCRGFCRGSSWVASCVVAFCGVLPGFRSLCSGVLRGFGLRSLVVAFCGVLLGCVRCVVAFCGFFSVEFVVSRRFDGFFPGLRFVSCVLRGSWVRCCVLEFCGVLPGLRSLCRGVLGVIPGLSSLCRGVLMCS